MAKSQEALNTFEYIQRPWGDLIYGTKEELQAIGIGSAMLFPGEPGGPKRAICVRDPRGFPVKLERFMYNGNVYTASIRLPGREPPRNQSVGFAPGVRKRCWYSWDEYRGAADALIAAGLVRRDQLPGQPGNRKRTVMIFPDGTISTFAPNARQNKLAHRPMAKRILMVTNAIYMVNINISEDEQAKRSDEDRQAHSDWEARMETLARPAPLVVVTHPSLDDLPRSIPDLRGSRVACNRKRAHLQLVVDNDRNGGHQELDLRPL